MWSYRNNDLSIQMGRFIRTMRKMKNLTQTELAERMGVTYQMIQKYEKGVSTISIARLSQIADALEIPVTSFLQPVPSVAENMPRLSEEEVSLVRLLRDIPDDHVRKNAVKLLQELVKTSK